MARISAAKRLYTLVLELKAERIESRRKLWHAFARAFNIEDKDKPALSAAYSDFLKLIEAVQAEIETRYGPQSDDGDVEELRQARLAPVNRLYSIFGEHSIHSDAEVLNNIDPAVVEGLRQVSATIQESTREQLLENNTLEEWRNKIEEVRLAVHSDRDIDPEFQLLIYDGLGEVDRAIVQYKLTGVRGLRRAIEQTCGAMVTRPTLFQTAVRKSKSVVKTIVLLNGLSHAVQDAAQLKFFALPPAMEEVCKAQEIAGTDLNAGNGDERGKPGMTVHELPLRSKDALEIEVEEESPSSN